MIGDFNMYKVLIVDDEKPARELLSNLIAWEKTGFEIVDNAKNGKEALKKYLELGPDLVITDIQMPGMDGLELIKQIRLLNKRQKFVILSCHEDFIYAREAIKIGVTDYLIKHFLTEVDLVGVLKKVKAELDERYEIIDHSKQLVVKKMYNDNDIDYKNNALKSIVFNNMEQNSINETIEKYNLNLQSEFFIVMCIVIDDYKKQVCSFNRGEEIKYSKSILSTVNNCFDGECFYNENGEFIAIVNLENNSSEMFFISACHSIAQRIRNNVSKDNNISLTISISKGFKKLSNLSERYLEAINIIKYKMFYGKGKTLFYNMHVVKNAILKPQIIEERLKNIKEELEKENIEKIINIINKLYNIDLKGFMQYNYIKYVNSCMYNIMIDYLNKTQTSYEKVFFVEYIPFEEIEKMETIEEISNWFCEVFARISHFNKKEEEQESNLIYNKRVKDIIEYIKKNYYQDIGLSQMSDEFRMHKSYLCRLFKQETNENFNDFLVRYRIEKAKQLMQSNDFKLYEIASKTGFSNYQQFCSAFKKVTGKTPMDFKCQLP
jgi:two-component system, response regulator YesN